MSETLPLTIPQLNALSAVLLSSESAPIALLNSAQTYFNGLEAIASNQQFQLLPPDECLLPSGKAIDPGTAARCIIDYNRTSKFIRGLHKAILAAKNRFGPTTLHILYAGTGPYAAMMLPLTTCFTPQEIQFTLLEAHPVTFQLLQQTIRRLQLEAYVKNMLLQDATQLYLSNLDPVHILITETMQAALKKEPQVAITQYLSPQRMPGAVFIPEKIQVWAGLSNPALKLQNMMALDGFAKEYIHPLGTVLELKPTPSGQKPEPFQEISIAIPSELTEAFPVLSLFTKVTIFENIQLMSDESVITQEQPVHDFRKDKKPASAARFHYQISENPGFALQLIP